MYMAMFDKVEFSTLRDILSLPNGNSFTKSFFHPIPNLNTILFLLDFSFNKQVANQLGKPGEKHMASFVSHFLPL